MAFSCAKIIIFFGILIFLGEFDEVLIFDGVLELQFGVDTMTLSWTGKKVEKFQLCMNLKLLERNVILVLRSQGI